MATGEISLAHRREGKGENVKIYIAASWKHQHAVEMLTSMLRDKGHRVLSFVENNNEDPDCKKAGVKALPFEEWVWSDSGRRSFSYDTTGAMTSDLVIYIGPSGKDAAAELGMAYAKCVPIYGLLGKGEDFGLMRRMVDWHYDYRSLLSKVELLAQRVDGVPHQCSGAQDCNHSMHR